MTTFLTALHVVVCIFMIAVILLQRGKGAEIGAVFGGGGSSTVFGSRGAGNFLTKLTTASAVIFMLTSLSLSYIATTSGEEGLFQDGVVEEADGPAAPSLFEEVETVPPQQPPAAAATPESAPAAESAGDAAEPEEAAGATP